jgi:penicillin-binding protein 1A
LYAFFLAGGYPAAPVLWYDKTYNFERRPALFNSHMQGRACVWQTGRQFLGLKKATRMADTKKHGNAAKPGRRSRFFRIFRFFAWSTLFVLLAGSCTVVGLYLHFSDDLPQINTLMDYRPPVVTTVYSDDGIKLAEIFKERRYVIGLDQMPDHLIKAFLSAEDSRFYEHQGVDFMGILRAVKKNLEAGGIVQGGSTITQQVTKSFLLTPERSFARKIREAILAYRIDNKFTKDQVLFLYLNQIYLGQGAYGVEAAARAYFGKKALDLNLAEAAILAGLPKAPSRDDPIRHPARARQRQIYVLNRMIEDDHISQAQAAQAQETPLKFISSSNLFLEQTPDYTEHIRRFVVEKYGEDMLYNGGLVIRTAVNIQMQKAGQAALKKGLEELDKRIGYRGPIKNLDPGQIEPFIAELAKNSEGAPLSEGMVVLGVVTEVSDSTKTTLVKMGGASGEIPIRNMRWARKPDPEKASFDVRISNPSQALSAGDVILVRAVKRPDGENPWELALEQEPEVQGALLCVETGTGQVKAMIGGYDFSKSQFNRAMQAIRQPGSAFKPIIYAAALDHPSKKFTPATKLIDTAIVFQDGPMDSVWKPKNYQQTFYGPTLLRDALAHSRNVVTIKILQEIGVGYAIDYARRLGITTPIARDLSIALGSSGTTLMEMVTAFSVFANQGTLISPTFITSIIDRDGRVLESLEPKGRRAIDESTAFVMTHLLQGAVENGTGWRAKALQRPVAGKTGTTNNLNDTWFVGYTPDFVTGVWVGFDNEKPLGKGETGSRTASPVWVDFMQEILKNRPAKTFPVSDGVVFARIDAESGLLATPQSKKTVFESFKRGTAPTQYAPITESPTIPGGLPRRDVTAEELMKKDI